jgi:muconate cycloisomerase
MKVKLLWTPMHIDEVRIYPLDLSFSTAFSHSRKRDGGARNILVEVQAEKGAVHGFGEGAPRQYVTGEERGEALESARKLVERDDFPWDLKDPSDLWAFIDAVPEEKTLHSALCALETAILDGLGRHLGVSVRAFLPGDFASEEIHYGATLPLSDPEKLKRFCLLIASAGIEKIRVKVGPSLADNTRSLEAVRASLSDRCDIRIDANGCWDLDTALSHVGLVKALEVRVVEQPLAPGDLAYPEVAAAFRACGAGVMADESACTLSETIGLIREGAFSMINVRLSKCGGFRRSLAMLGYLRTAGIPFQIGCQLGESGILSAAGRALALSSGDAIYYDGSYDAFLLSENLTSSHVTFGVSGKAGWLPGDGLGIEVPLDKLQRMCPTYMSVKRPNGLKGIK